MWTIAMVTLGCCALWAEAVTEVSDCDKSMCDTHMSVAYPGYYQGCVDANNQRHQDRHLQTYIDEAQCFCACGLPYKSPCNHTDYCMLGTFCNMAVETEGSLGFCDEKCNRDCECITEGNPVAAFNWCEQGGVCNKKPFNCEETVSSPIIAVDHDGASHQYINQCKLVNDFEYVRGMYPAGFSP